MYVTGILATRSLDSKRDRLISILINPLISCAARLPVYVLFATAFFDSHRGLVVFSLYALGVVLAFIVAKGLNRFVEPGETTTFVLELPPYRMPKLSGVLVQTWERGKEFLEKAATVILLAVVIVWALSNLPLGVDSGSPDSLVGRIGSALAPIFKPAGFGHGRQRQRFFRRGSQRTHSRHPGVLYGTTGEAGLIAAIRASWTPLAAYSFLVMSLVYIPCAATIAIRRDRVLGMDRLCSNIYSLCSAGPLQSSSIKWDACLGWPEHLASRPSIVVPRRHSSICRPFRR